jgi:glycosyltransferase involved in cell wall biosynthesis
VSEDLRTTTPGIAWNCLDSGARSARRSSASSLVRGSSWSAGLDAHSSAATFADGSGSTVTCGFVGPIDRAYGEATVFVHPSLEEPFGMSVAEARSSRGPAVGGERAGAVPWLLDGGQGRLADASRPESMAAAICDLMGNTYVRARLGEAARAHAAAAVWPRADCERTPELYNGAQAGRK